MKGHRGPHKVASPVPAPVRHQEGLPISALGPISGEQASQGQAHQSYMPPVDALRRQYACTGTRKRFSNANGMQ
jgi:hypothetical protein